MELSGTDLRTSPVSHSKRKEAQREDCSGPLSLIKKQPIYFINENKCYIITHSGIEMGYYLETHPQISLLI